MEIFNALGFRWNREAVPSVIPTHSIERVAFRFHRMFAELVWDASVIEGTPFTFTEVQTLLDGVTVGGHKISDQDQVLRLARSFKHLPALVKTGHFALTKAAFVELQGGGGFRGEGFEATTTPVVDLGKHGRYIPLPTVAGAPELNRIFDDGLAALDECHPFEKAMAFFLFGALRMFFFEGNKRTSRLMMNGVLMSNGIDAINIPAASARTFNEKMARFYMRKEATEMMKLLVDCHPEAGQIHGMKEK